MLESEPRCWTILLLKGELKQTLRMPLASHAPRWKYPPYSHSCKQAARALSALDARSTAAPADLALCLKQYCHLVVLTRSIILFLFRNVFFFYCVGKDSWHATAHTTEWVLPQLQIIRRKILKPVSECHKRCQQSADKTISFRWKEGCRSWRFLLEGSLWDTWL